MMNLFSREEYIERRKMLRWFVEQFDENNHDRSIDEMIGVVTEKLGLSYNDLCIISNHPDSYPAPELEFDEDKWMFYYKFLSAMDIDRSLNTKDKELCRLIARKLGMQEGFINTLISIIPQYVRRNIPETTVKYSFGAIKKSMVAAAMLVPLGYVIGTSYS